MSYYFDPPVGCYNGETIEITHVSGEGPMSYRVLSDAGEVLQCGRVAMAPFTASPFNARLVDGAADAPLSAGFMECGSADNE
jgi:hypothetical protein